jgi:hypothetical protein
VAEAKGRSRGVEASVVRKLQVQKRSVRTVEGKEPWLAVGTVAHFGKDALEINAYDPSELDDAVEPIDIAIDRSQYFRAYYLPFLRAIESGSETEGPDGYLVAASRLGQLNIGLPETIVDALRRDERLEPESWPATILGLSDIATDDPDSPIMPDGTYFDVNWGDDPFSAMSVG